MLGRGGAIRGNEAVTVYGLRRSDGPPLLVGGADYVLPAPAASVDLRRLATLPMDQSNTIEECCVGEGAKKAHWIVTRGGLALPPVPAVMFGMQVYPSYQQLQGWNVWQGPQNGEQAMGGHYQCGSLGYDAESLWVWGSWPGWAQGGFARIDWSWLAANAFDICVMRKAPSFGEGKPMSELGVWRGARLRERARKGDAILNVGCQPSDAWDGLIAVGGYARDANDDDPGKMNSDETWAEAIGSRLFDADSFVSIADGDVDTWKRWVTAAQGAAS